MKKERLVRSFILVAAFQLVVLAGEYLVSVYPLWTGESAILKIVPVDPRSLFRGNYVLLNYDIASLDEKAIAETLQLKKGDVAYVQLKQIDGVFHAQNVTTEAPEEGFFIQGRVQHFYREDGTVSLSMHYGIEAYFSPKKKALEIEEKFRDRQREDAAMAYAEVRIAASGRAAIEGILWELP